MRTSSAGCAVARRSRLGDRGVGGRALAVRSRRWDGLDYVLQPAQDVLPHAREAASHDQRVHQPGRDRAWVVEGLAGHERGVLPAWLELQGERVVAEHLGETQGIVFDRVAEPSLGNRLEAALDHVATPAVHGDLAPTD